jgi:hypothetical protein
LTLGLLPIFGPQTKNLLRVFCPFWGPTGAFRVSGAQNQILLWGIFLFGESPKLKFYSGVFAHFGGPLGLLGFRGSKSNFISGAFTHR